MGSQNSNSQQPNYRHFRLGLVSCTPSFQSDNNPPKMTLFEPIESQKAYNQYKKNLQNFTNEDTKEVLFLPESHIFQKSTYCNTSGTTKLDFQLYKFTLEQQITTRSNKNNNFTQSQLWFIFYTLIQAGMIFQGMKSVVGNVHPLNIFMNQAGRVKILPVQAIPGGLGSFGMVVQNRMADVFLAPEEIDNTLIDQGIYPPKVDPIRAELFSLGLTILSCATLQTTQIYSRTLSSISLKAPLLIHHIQTLKSKYSDYFSKTIQNLLDFQPSKRKLCSQLFRELHNFQDDILSLKRFTVNNCTLLEKTSDMNISANFEPSILKYLPKNGYSQLENAEYQGNQNAKTSNTFWL